MRRRKLLALGVANSLGGAGALCAQYRYIVQLGMVKTGTSSTYLYFKDLGYKSCDQISESLWGLMDEAQRRNEPILSHAVGKCENFGEIMKVMGTGPDAIVPQLSQLPALKAYMTPRKTLFVLNVRSPRSWLQSINAWNNLRRRLVAKEIEGKPAGVGHRDEDLLNWYRGTSDYVEWSFRHRHDFVKVNISNSSTFEALYRQCNDSNRHFPLVDARRAYVDKRVVPSARRGGASGRPHADGEIAAHSDASGRARQRVVGAPKKRRRPPIAG